jgi:hypothetical protein
MHVTGGQLYDYPPGTIKFEITLIPVSGPPVVIKDSFLVNAEPNDPFYNFDATIQRTWSQYGIVLAGTYQLAGSACLYAKDATWFWNCVDISFQVGGAGATSITCATCSATIGDRVWYDFNLNGIQDAGEPGMNGITLTLTGQGQTLQTITNQNEFYQFPNLPFGDYKVEIAVPAGYALTLTNTPGSTTANDSNPNPSIVTLPNGSSDLTIDFGLVNAEDQCPPAGTTGLPTPAGTLYWGVNPVNGDVYVRYDQSRGLNDNSYGANIVNWPRNHNFSDLASTARRTVTPRIRAR